MTTTASKATLPESITSQLDTKNKMCRLEWRSTHTKATGHGDWFPLSEKDMIQSHVNAHNSKGDSVNWIGYN
jgi:hypothetical protein